MAFVRPHRTIPWLAGALLLGAALAGAVLAGAWVQAALIVAAAGGFVLAQCPRPVPPFVGPMKRRASDFLPLAGRGSILHDTSLPHQLRDDLEATQPFLAALRGQIDGVQQDVEQGVLSVVTRVQEINQLSVGQRERIASSLSGVDAMREAVTVPGAILDKLGTMLAERDAVIAGNYEGLETLAHEFQALRDTVDVISQVADKAFFLAVNASVEAHRHGEAGKAFGLIATEMRALATQTAEGARQVGASINSFADRMQSQIRAAMPGPAQEDGGAVNQLVRELEAAQGEVAAISARLGSLMQVMEAGHSEMVGHLSDILGRLQFQDVMRQRLSQVGEALGGLQDLAAQSAAGVPPERGVRDLLDEQRQSYVMESQKLVHARSIGEPDEADPVAAAPALKIELF